MSFGSYSGSWGGPRRRLGRMGGKDEITGKVFDIDITKRLLAYLKPYRVQMIKGLLLMLLSAGLAMLVPYLIKLVIDDYIGKQPTSALSLMALAILGVYALNFWATWARTRILRYVANNVFRVLRRQLFAHYQELSMHYYDQHSVGSLISRVLSDVGVINELLSQGIISMLSDLVTLVAITVIMLAMDVRLALLCLSVVPLMVVATLVFARKARVAYRETREKVSNMTGRLAEDLGAMRVIQAFAKEGRKSGEFDRVNRENRDANVAAIALSSSFTPVVEALSMLATCVILWFGGNDVIKTGMTIGTLVAFLTYTSRLFQPIMNLSMVFNTWQAAMAGGERIFEILDIEPDIKDLPDAVVLADVEGAIRFEHVDFSYVPDVPVLQDVSLEIGAGQTVALVGPTGAGKTTISALLMRFYDVTAGSISIDGIDIRQATVASLRKQLGVVPQEPFLFQGSIADNIAFGRPTATREEIIAAAKAANAHDFVSQLPKGYDTEIMEGSSNVSLGQRQLICFARVILAAPRILVLDEATSSVDLRTEGLIQDALETLMAGRTSLIIAHRLATVQRADRIVVIDDGRIAESGTHAKLLALDGVYAHLYRTQFINAEAG